MRKLWIAVLVCCTIFVSCDLNLDGDASDFELLGGDSASELQGYWATEDGYIILNFEDDVCYFGGTIYSTECSCTYSFDSSRVAFYFGGYYCMGYGVLSDDRSSMSFAFVSEDESYTCNYIGSVYSDEEESADQEEVTGDKESDEEEIADEESDQETEA